MNHPLDDEPGVRYWECASHDIEAAPGRAIVVNGYDDGRRQQIRVEASEVDEFARRLHQAKRCARGPVVSGRARVVSEPGTL